METFDVYAYGVIAASTLHLLSQPFPAADGYAEIAQTCQMTGGEALNSAIVLSRLGLRVILDGNWIGDTPEGRQLLDMILAFQIDTRRLKIKPGYAGVREIVFSDEASRTIFGSYIDLLTTTRKWNVPRRADLALARLVCVDPPFGDESARVGWLARQLGLPYVTIDCPPESELAQGAEALIISGEYRGQHAPQTDRLDLFQQYRERAGGLVVFTAGSEDILYARPGGPLRRFKPYPVRVVDSAGAGDSFRAGVIYGLLQFWADEEIIAYASALAGLVCASFPGVLNSPTHASVLEFIQSQPQPKTRGLGR